jgi:hypothetical protein
VRGVRLAGLGHDRIFQRDTILKAEVIFEQQGGRLSSACSKNRRTHNNGTDQRCDNSKLRAT